VKLHETHSIMGGLLAFTGIVDQCGREPTKLGPPNLPS
jgi:hypothetical protein